MPCHFLFIKVKAIFPVPLILDFPRYILLYIELHSTHHFLLYILFPHLERILSHFFLSAISAAPKLMARPDIHDHSLYIAPIICPYLTLFLFLNLFLSFYLFITGESTYVSCVWISLSSFYFINHIGNTIH